MNLHKLMSKTERIESCCFIEVITFESLAWANINRIKQITYYSTIAVVARIRGKP
jgi:hypothetical protein